MDNINSYNQQVQNADVSNSALYNKALEMSNKKDDMLSSLIQEPLQLASGEFLQKGLSKIGGAVSATGRKLGLNLDNIGDMIKKGSKPTDILKQALSQGGQDAYNKAQNLINKVSPPTKESINKRFNSLSPEQKKLSLTRSKNINPNDFEAQNKVMDDLQTNNSLQNLKTDFKKPTTLSKPLNKLVDKSQGILDDAKKKLEQKRTQLNEGINEEKESGTSFRDIVNKTKKRFFGESKPPFENELTKTEQLQNIREQLSKSKEGRKALRRTQRREAENESLKKSGLEPLKTETLEDRPEGAVKGTRPTRPPPQTVEEKSKQGVASNVDDIPEEQERLKNIREEREIQGDFNQPQDQDFLKQQSIREQGYKQGDNIATRDQKPISQVLQETMDKTAPPQPQPKPKPAPQPEPEPAPQPEPTPKVNPADQTQGLDPSTLDEKAGFKRGTQDIKAKRPASPTLSTEQKNIFEEPSNPRLDFYNNYSSMSDVEKYNYGELRRATNPDVSDFVAKNKLLEHAKNGTLPEELQTGPQPNTAQNLASEVSGGSSSSGGPSIVQGTAVKTDDESTLQQQASTTGQENFQTQQKIQQKTQEEEEEGDKKQSPEEEEEGDVENLAMQGTEDIAGEATGGLANLGISLGLMLLPELFGSSKPSTPPPVQLQQETNPSAQFGDT